MVPESFYKNVPETYVYRVNGYYTTRGYLLCSKFGHLPKLTFKYNFKCKTYLARYGHHTLNVKSLPTP